MNRKLQKGILKRFLDAFVTACFPRRCIACNAFLDVRVGDDHDRAHGVGEKGAGAGFSSIASFGASSGVVSTFLCRRCASGLTQVESPFCSKCGLMFKSRKGENHVCGRCIEKPPHYRMARAAGVYEDAVKAMVLQLKYKGKTRMAPLLSGILYRTYLSFWKKGDVDIIVPVPLHLRRLRKRGFNQSFLLVKEWPGTGKANQQKPGRLKIETDLLKRTRQTPPQTGLSRKQRARNVQKAFALNPNMDVKGKWVLLVDDVLTTGATVNECARILVGNGAKRVDVLTLARAQ